MKILTTNEETYSTYQFLSDNFTYEVENYEINNDWFLCKNCGSEKVRDGVKFCDNCGVKIEWDEIKSAWDNQVSYKIEKELDVKFRERFPNFMEDIGYRKSGEKSIIVYKNASLIIEIGVLELAGKMIVFTPNKIGIGYGLTEALLAGGQ